MFTRKCGYVNEKNKITAVDIGPPTDLRQDIHVTKNPETGRLEGLPTSWAKFWYKLSTNKQNEDPDKAQTTSKFYITENEKPPEEPSSAPTEIKKDEEEEEEEFIYEPIPIVSADVK